jgi:hypothetical protein
LPAHEGRRGPRAQHREDRAHGVAAAVGLSFWPSCDASEVAGARLVPRGGAEYAGRKRRSQADRKRVRGAFRQWFQFLCGGEQLGLARLGRACVRAWMHRLTEGALQTLQTSLYLFTALRSSATFYTHLYA